MASQLREVLNHFSARSIPLSLSQLASEMQIEPGVLDGMIDYWVRKGRLREVNGTGQSCHSCGIQGACPFIISLPRYYELVTDEPSAL
jgi:hypothetical protein